LTKPKNPLFGFDARGTIANLLTFRHRDKQTIAESKPFPKDAKTSGQLAWRTMYQLATDLWHTLSPAEQATWHTLGVRNHMSGYSAFMSQCLRPNPGIYLPLAGGTMSGNIDMASHKITGLPAPTLDSDATTKVYTDAIAAAAAKITLGFSTTNILSDAAFGPTPFTAKITGTITATALHYNTETNEGSLNTTEGVGRIILYNTTRGNTRLITKANRGTNTIYTLSSIDDWASGDDITTLSPTVGSNFVDLDLSGFIAASVTGLIIEIYIYDTTVAGQLIRAHPYGTTYATYKSFPLWNKVINIFDTLDIIVPIVSQKLSFLVTASGANTAYVVLRYHGQLSNT
jgi:hypothetical protein